MMKLTINKQAVEVDQGATILDAANKLGIQIPTMCHLKGYSNHPSCMVCMVKDIDKGTLQPSCAFPAQEGLNISTTDADVIEARKDALELLLSDHVGDCEAPCRVACPAFMDVPKMNRLIANGEFVEALKVVKEEIALPMVLGYVCSAPCEKACRRKTIDGAISICQLKKISALTDAEQDKIYYPEKEINTGKKIAIVGSGIAGLSAAFTLTRLGHKAVVFEENEMAGGTLRNETESLPKDMLAKEISILEGFGVEIKLNQIIDKKAFDTLIEDYDSVLLAYGDASIVLTQKLSLELNAQKTGLLVDKKTFETSIENVFACGSVVRKQKMAVQALANGKHAAHAIHKLLVNIDIPNGKDFFNSRFGKLEGSEFEFYTVEGKDNDAVVVQDKMQNLTKEEAIREAQRCMHCDCRKASDCKLRDLSQDYTANQKNYQTSERNLLKKQFAHKQIVYEQEKCIRCGLCVDITEKEGEDLGLTFVGRGFDVRIGVPLNETIDKSLSKVAIKCAEACPTGALALK